MTQSSQKTRIALNGAYGRMCGAIAEQTKANCQFEIAFGVDNKPCGNKLEFPVFTSFDDTPECDVVVDFSTHTATIYALEYALKNNLPIVIATTGHCDDEKATIVEAGKHIPIFFSNNTSLGIYLQTRLAILAAEFFDDSFDVEIIETHHRVKSDAPSGTALSLANAVKVAKTRLYGEEYTISFGHSDKRKAKQIGVHSIRGGTVVGKHEIVFLGDDERLSIIHEAENKNVYAHGVFRAIDLIMSKQNGIFTMDDLIKI